MKQTPQTSHSHKANSPKVSIIIPTLNRIAYIKECVDSAISQTLCDIEIICVDAGSSDGTLEVLQDYAKKDSRVRVIISPKKSYGYQMNLGIKESRGEYFGIIESDDYVAPTMYERLYSIAKDSKCPIIKAKCVKFYGVGDSQTFDEIGEIAPKKEHYNKVLDISSPDIKFGIKLLNQIGIFSLQFVRENNIAFNESAGANYQDNGFFFQSIILAKSIYLLDEVFYFLRRDNPTSSVFATNKAIAMCDEYDFIRAWLAKNPHLERIYAPYAAQYRWGNYGWQIDITPIEFKQEVIKRMSQDMRVCYEKGELVLFDIGTLLEIKELIDEPMRYYYNRCCKINDDEKGDFAKRCLYLEAQLYRLMHPTSSRQFRGAIKFYLINKIKRKFYKNVIFRRIHKMRQKSYKRRVKRQLDN